MGLNGSTDHEERETSQCRRTQVDNQESQANRHLDRRSQGHLEESCTEVNARDICGDVIDEFSVGEGRTCACRESERAVVDGSDQSTTKENTSCCTSVEEVVIAQRGEDLH